MSDLKNYREVVNYEILKKLNKLSITNFNTMMKEVGKKYTDKDSHLEYTKLKKYCKYVIEKDNKNDVSYEYADMKTCGRIYAANPSIQSLNKEIRGALSDSITVDIDMVNCAPNILQSICKKHNIFCPNLSLYIINREKCLSELINEYGITRDDAKDCYLMALNKHEYTTKINKKIVKNKTFIEFDKEISTIMDIIFDMDEYKNEFYKYVKGVNYNIKGKFMNLIITKKENEFLQKAIKISEKFGVNVSTPFFDGFTAYPENKDIDKLIKKLNTEFESEIKWTTKEHNTTLIKILENIKVVEIDSYYGKSIFDVAEHCINGLLKDKIFIGSSNKEVYLLTDDIILDNYESISTELVRILYKQDYYRVDEDDKIIQVSKEVSEMNNLVKVIMQIAPKNKTFIKDIWDYTRFKLFFKNGYYDFKEKRFIKGEFNRTFIKIDRDYESKRNEKAYNILMDKILNPVFSITDENDKKIREQRIQLLNNFLYKLARILASHIEDKSYIELEGLRNSGKGVISDLLKNCYGNYIRTSNSSNFVYKKNVADSAKALSWLIPLEFSRLCITQEIKPNEILDGTMVKKFCSGGDYMEARNNYTNEKEFRIQCSLLICCNDEPTMEPADAKDFAIQYQMKSKFIDDDYLEKDKIPTFKYYKKEDIKELLSDSDIVNEFINIIFEAYNNKVEYPKEIKKENDDVKEDDDYNKLFDLFEITNNKDDFISNEDLRAYLKTSNIPFNLCKCKKLLITKGAKTDRNTDKRGLCRIVTKD